MLPNTSWAGSRSASADAAGEPEPPRVAPRLRRPGSLLQAVVPCDEVSWLGFFSSPSLPNRFVGLHNLPASTMLRAEEFHGLILQHANPLLFACCLPASFSARLLLRAAAIAPGRNLPRGPAVPAQLPSRGSGCSGSGWGRFAFGEIPPCTLCMSPCRRCLDNGLALGLGSKTQGNKTLVHHPSDTSASAPPQNPGDHAPRGGAQAVPGTSQER